MSIFLSQSLFMTNPTRTGRSGGAAPRWLHHSLVALKQSLQQLGSDLLILSGDAHQQLSQLIGQTGAEAVYWNRCYEPALVRRDEA